MGIASYQNRISVLHGLARDEMMRYGGYVLEAGKNANGFYRKLSSGVVVAYDAPLGDVMPCESIVPWAEKADGDLRVGRWF